MKKQYLATLISAICIGTGVLTGCSASGVEKPEMESTQSNEVVPAQTIAADGQEEAWQRPALGERVSGFTVEELGEIQKLGAETVLFSHEKSGAEILLIKNDDTELSFSISYQTPYVDETDTNHIFEHAILASSEKYPSSDLFFDLAYKSYNTYVNAITTPTFTIYPVCSQSQEQLLKLTDAYLSCMTAPDIMENENIFKREALRFELEDEDSPITMQGTVFSEDFGYLTDIQENASNGLGKAMYPDTIAANAIGQLHRNYKELTYEKMMETYDRCYHFDNSLMILYGDLDYKLFLEFIDGEYLSKAERNHTDLSAYQEEQVPSGHVRQRIESPAYEGDSTEKAAILYYGIDLSSASWEDILDWDILTYMLNNEYSPLQVCARKEGITGQIIASVQVGTAKPILTFYLLNAEEEQTEAFERAIKNALEEIAAHGISQDIYEGVIKENKLAQYMARNDINIGVNIGMEIMTYWCHTGKTDLYSKIEECLGRLEMDKQQEALKRLTESALHPIRSATVTAVPVPGLAEKAEQEIQDYLAEMKTSMTEEEITQMIADTREFREWNKVENHNTDFIMDPKNLPEPEGYTSFEKKELGQLISYTAPVEVEQAGHFALNLDLSNIPAADIYYLGIYEMLIGKIGTRDRSAEQTAVLCDQYLYNLNYVERYIDNRPMVMVKWYGLTEDYDEGLRLLLELFEKTDFSDREKICQVMDQFVPDYDQSRYMDEMHLAVNQAIASINNNWGFNAGVNSQDQYVFMKEVLRRLKEEDGYGEEFAGKMKAISNSLLNQKGMAVIHIASREELPALESQSEEILSSLPVLDYGMPDYSNFFNQGKKRAICVNTSSQQIVQAGDMGVGDGLTGTDMPFLMALSDKYIVPRVRFQMGAYSAGLRGNLKEKCVQFYSHSDPNVGATLDVFAGADEYLKDMEISQVELNSYILNAFGDLTTPRGIFEKQMENIALDLKGEDADWIYSQLQKVKETTLEDQDQAARRLQAVLDQGHIAVVGNQTSIELEKERFDWVKDYRGK